MKKAIIDQNEYDVRVSHLASKFGMVESMTCTILKNKETDKGVDVVVRVTQNKDY